MPKQRVIVFSKFFWFEGGGAELATYLITKNILSRHFDVTIVSGTKSPCPDILRNCRYIYCPSLRSRHKPIEWIMLFANIESLKKLVDKVDTVYIASHTLIPLAIIVKSIKPNVQVILHAHNYQLITYTSVVLARRNPDLATDIIVERGEHRNIIRTFFAGVGHYLNILNKLSLYFIDKVICVSKRQFEILSRNIPILKSKAVVIYNPPPPTPRDFRKRHSAEPTLLYVGGDSFIKGFNNVVEILPELIRRYNCKVYIVGIRETSKVSLLRKLRKKMSKRINVLRRIPRNELLKLHEVSWALLFPSICEEPLPYAVVEACIMGTVPIASRVGGIPEIVEGTFAEKLLFEPGNTTDLINKLEQILSRTKEELINISIELIQRSREKFDLNRIENALLRVFTNNLN